MKEYSTELKKDLLKKHYKTSKKSTELKGNWKIHLVRNLITLWNEKSGLLMKYLNNLKER
jgi:hypothetical protein